MKIFPESCDCILIVHLLMVTCLKFFFLGKFHFEIKQIRHFNKDNSFYNSFVGKIIKTHIWIKWHPCSQLCTGWVCYIMKSRHEPFFRISANPLSSNSPAFLLLVTYYLPLHRALSILRNLCFTDAPALSKTYFLRVDTSERNKHFHTNSNIFTCQNSKFKLVI